MNSNFFTEIIELIKSKKPGKDRLNSMKNVLSKKYKLKTIPTNIEILLNAEVKDVVKIKEYLLTKPIRTISGVAVVAIMTKPMKCPHGKCLMCPGGVDSAFGSVPQSYTGKEPATRRAIRNNYDAYLQVMNRLEQYVVQGHVPEKVELIVMGGTFPSVDKKYQEDFITNSYKAMNDFSRLFFNNGKFDFIKFRKFFELPGNINDKERLERIHKKLLKIKDKKTNLEKEQNFNENSDIRCVALCIETRPDYANLKYAKNMLRFGATRVELGIQSVYDDVLAKIERGHSVEDSIKATKILKDLGFKVSYQVMPGLPGVSREEDLAGLIALFEYEDFRPDMLKIYPCMVLKGTKLYDLWKKKKYIPLTTKKAASIIAKFKECVPEYCRISRVQRDIPTFMTEAGVDMTNLRQLIDKNMKKKCRCIRCREAGHKLKDKKIKVKIEFSTTFYEASGGVEFFIAAENVKNDALFGICRLRFPDTFLTKEIDPSSSLVRELHVYGEAVELGKKGLIQHKGIGKKLLEEAENITKMYNRKKTVVISGVGVRTYYKKLGYKKEGKYMVKKV